MSIEKAVEDFEAAQIEAEEWLQNEVGTLRTGRVKPDLVDGVVVELYGARTPLKGVASIAVSDARTMVISPWDPAALAPIKKAITEADLGVQPTEDGRVLRLSFPSLTEERREQTIKMLHKKAEEARVKLRRGRDEALSMLKTEKQDSDITEDDFYEGREKLDKLIDDANKTIDELISKKEEEIRTV